MGREKVDDPNADVTVVGRVCGVIIKHCIVAYSLSGNADEMHLVQYYMPMTPCNA